jgi:hypothetical protein
MYLTLFFIPPIKGCYLLIVTGYFRFCFSGNSCMIQPAFLCTIKTLRFTVLEAQKETVRDSIEYRTQIL